MKKILLFILISQVFISLTFAEVQKLRIVTTLSTYADITKKLGGDYVSVSYVASPKFNPHFIEPKPSDVLNLKRADLFIHSGLDLEAWREPLVNASGNIQIRPGAERELDLSIGVNLLEVPAGVPSRALGDIHLYGNPHYFIDPRAGLVIIDSISEKLSSLLPQYATEIKKNQAELKITLEAKISEWQKQKDFFKNLELIGYHKSWIYLTDFLGASINEYLEPKPGIPPTAKHILELREYIKTNLASGKKVAIIQAAFEPEREAEQLAEDSGVPHIFLCQNVGEKTPECGDYISMLEYNVNQLERIFAIPIHKSTNTP